MTVQGGSTMLLSQAARDHKVAYDRAYYAANRERINAKHRVYGQHPQARVLARANHERRRTRDMVDLRALKLLRGCFDCGYDANSDALEFDHRPGTGKKIGRGLSLYAGASPARLAAEIAKCDVVCSNCHSIRTANRRKES